MRALVFVATLVSSTSIAAERWPTPKIPEPVKSAILEGYDSPFASFHDTWHREFIQQYKPFGDYLNYGKHRLWRNDGEVVMHDGLPMVRHDGRAYYNPVTLAQFALTKHGRALNGDSGATKQFLAAANKLIELQTKSGALPYSIQLNHHGEILKPGWISAMAQGQALSVFARAYNATHDARYTRAGSLALRAMLDERNGVATTLSALDPTLRKYRFFEEYPTRTPYYTLNGFIFTLLGLYDWSHTNSTTRKRSRLAFRAGMRTLARILPLYDVDGWSTYDLSHIVEDRKPYMPLAYAGIHVYLLHNINHVAPHPTIQKYADKWQHSIDEANKPLRFITIHFDHKSPQPLGRKITISLTAESSRRVSGKLYKFSIKHNGEWRFPQDYSADSRFVWTPTEPGHYDFGFYVKEPGAAVEYENFRHVPFLITQEQQ